MFHFCAKLFHQVTTSVYLGDSWEIHQCEVDHVRGEDFQVDGLIADPLQRERERRKQLSKFDGKAVQRE